MKRVLITYASKEGQTYKIAKVISDELRGLGYSTRIIDVKEDHGWTNPEDYDAILVGGPIHLSRFPKSLRSWVKLNSKILTKRPSAFFGVCLGVLQKDNARVQNEIQAVLKSFFEVTDWNPTISKLFAGAIRNSKYNFIVRYVMRKIARKAGEETDPRQDYEYTNWDEVQQFARNFAKTLTNGKRKDAQDSESLSSSVG